MPKRFVGRGGRTKKRRRCGRLGGPGSLKTQVGSLQKAEASTRKQVRRAQRKSARALESAQALERRTAAVHKELHTTEAHVEDAGKQMAESPRKRKPFIIVGVGASAGGYGAFSQLLANLSPEAAGP